MSRLSRTLSWLEAHPEYLIQVFLGVALVATGLYLAGPWYVGVNTNPIAIATDSAVGHVVIGLGYALSGVVGLYGVIRNSLQGRYVGTLLMFASFVFMTLLRLFTIGFTPVIWVLMLTLAMISGVLHIVESRRRVRE